MGSLRKEEVISQIIAARRLLRIVIADIENQVLHICQFDREINRVRSFKTGSADPDTGVYGGQTGLPRFQGRGLPGPGPAKAAVCISEYSAGEDLAGRSTPNVINQGRNAGSDLSIGIGFHIGNLSALRNTYHADMSSWRVIGDSSRGSHRA